MSRFKREGVKPSYKPKKKKQSKISLGIKTWQEQEWQGMPEFTQEDQTPGKSITVHFESRKDMDAFAVLIDQKITMQTRSVWYPKAEIERTYNKRYSDVKVKK